MNEKVDAFFGMVEGIVADTMNTLGTTVQLFVLVALFLVVGYVILELRKSRQGGRG